MAEVRLLNNVTTVGNVAPDARRGQDNLLIRGDALHALTSLKSLPDFAAEYVGKVKLVYIDPPFNTRQAFGDHYDDNLDHSVWLTMMRDRLVQIRDLLAPDGTVWVHCDDAEQHRLRAVLDEVMGAGNFVATVIWEKRYSRSNDATFSVSHDYIHVYARSPAEFARSRNRLERRPDQEKQYRNPDNDPDGPWRAIPLDAPGVRGDSLSYKIVTPSGAEKYPPTGRHWSMTEDTAPFECVVDSATGVGKTYIFAGAMEYLARARGVRNFALIAPSRTILNKTIDQFTLGHDKAIVGDLSMPLTLVTADNFNSPATAAEMDDDSRVKLYVFTVQAILQPKSKSDRKTHEFQEGLGAAFYQRLKQIEDLVIFADEHHSYFGEQFSSAVRDLDPWVLIGLTATPNPKTPKDWIVYRYPLAAAIADQYVKTPVIVGRRDDKKDARTKLLDGVTLLETKRAIADRYAQVNGCARINPIMLVVARDIDEAEAWADIARADDFKSGAYADAVLVVHSRAVKAENEERELRRLQDVEHPGSPIRVLISVQMLKEGWDVKNVYVLLSTQPSLSDILTEQVLGRGLRLPWGRYTTVQMLDTLEVIAHDRFDDLLKRKGVLSEEFVDYRTRAVVRTNALGETVVVRESVEVTPVVATPSELSASGGRSPGGGQSPTQSTQPGGQTAEQVLGKVTLTDLDSRTAAGEAEQMRMSTEVAPSRPIDVPLVRQEALENPFSLSDIHDEEPFRDLGRRLHVDPEDTLRRTVIGAKVIVDEDGIKRTELVTSQAVDIIQASGITLTEDELRTQLTAAILGSPIVSSIRDEGGSERNAVKRILNAFFEGLDGNADELLSAYLERATARLIALITSEARRYAQSPRFKQTVKMYRVSRLRSNSRPVTENRHGPFQRGHAYSGWQRSVYSIEWFHSSPERDLANLLDDASEVESWLRLQVGELPILWADGKQQYNADFVVVEAGRDHWVVEVKADNQMSTEEVLGKREAAKRWTNAVNDSGQVRQTWRYLLVAQRDIRDAKGSWPALRSLGT